MSGFRDRYEEYQRELAAEQVEINNQRENSRVLGVYVTDQETGKRWLHDFMLRKDLTRTAMKQYKIGVDGHAITFGHADHMTDFYEFTDYQD